jgi:hypothetical protein
MMAAWTRVPTTLMLAQSAFPALVVIVIAPSRFLEYLLIEEFFEISLLSSSELVDVTKDYLDPVHLLRDCFFFHFIHVVRHLYLTFGNSL